MPGKLTTLYRGVAFALQLSEGAAPTSIQLFKTGTFHHAKYGTFNITPEMLLSMKNNFDSRVRGIDIAIDYAHESDQIAAGWFTSLELRENGTQLWGATEWTEKGASVVLGKEFRYVSPDFTFDYQDNESLKKFGPTLLGAGLTNRPVLKGMAPIELSEGENMDEKDKQIAALMAQIEEMKKASGDSECAMNEMRAKLAEFEKKAQDEATAKAAADAKALEDAKLAERKNKFDLMLSEGRAVEAQRDSFMVGDVDTFAQLAEKINLTPTGTGNEPPAKSTIGKTAGDEILELAEQRAEKDSITLSAAIRLVRSENKELEEKYLQEVSV